MKHILPDPKKVAFLFLLVGCVWIIFSSKLLVFAISKEKFLFWEIVKGLVFILLTSIFLYRILLHFNKRLLEALRMGQQHENQFRKFYEESPLPTWISDPVRGILFMNKAALDLLGYTAEQVFGSLPEELVNLEENRYPEDSVKSAKVGKEKGVRSFYLRSGEHYYLDLSIHTIEYQGRPARLVIANNVTGLIQAEKEKQRVNNELYHYKKALDRSALLSVTDLNGVIEDVNSKFCEITKFSREELIGKNHNVINSGYHPTSFFRNLFKTVRRGEVWRGEICNMAKDGRLFWVDMSVIPVMDQFNEAERYMAISYPITDRKAAELKSEKVQQELMTFMYKASHNLRGPVATLSGLLNIARMEVKEGNSLSYINMLNERTKHLEYTLGELIDITKIKQEDLSLTVISFERLVKKALGRFKKEIAKYKIEVETQLPFNLEFRSDSKLVASLFHYLIDNSIKFRNNDAPRICISVREQAGGIIIVVSDNGPGIDEEIRGRVYEMYFRGNERSTGSGLGLYIVSSIVERLHGYISLQSKPGQGASFIIFLPDVRQLEELRKKEGGTYLPDKSMSLNQN